MTRKSFRMFFLSCTAVVLACGIVLIIIGLVSSLKYSRVKKVDKEDRDVRTKIHAALFITGTVVIITSLLGFACLWRGHHRCMLITYANLLFILFVLHLIVGLYFLLYEKVITEERHRNETITSNGTATSNLTAFLAQKLKDFKEKYGKPTEKNFTKQMDDVQQSQECCGINGYMDYLDFNWKSANEKDLEMVPKSCCREKWETCNYRSAYGNRLENFLAAHTMGCGERFKETEKCVRESQRERIREGKPIRERRYEQDDYNFYKFGGAIVLLLLLFEVLGILGAWLLIYDIDRSPVLETRQA